MRILITGATGFIGKHLVEALKDDGHELGLLVRDAHRASEVKAKNVAFLEGDLDDLSLVGNRLGEFAPDVCAHLAWADIPDYSAAVSKRNLDRSIALVDCLLKETGCRKIVVTGSCFEYGKTQGECAEWEPVQITSYIAWAKQALCNYLAVLAKPSMLQFVWLRLFYVYGPGQRADSLLPTIIKDMLRGKHPTVRNPFDAQDFVYVADAAQAIRLAVNADMQSGIYNIGSGQATPVLDMCRLVERSMGKSGQVSEALSRQQPSREPACFWANNAKAKQHLGWAPKYPLAEGIQRHVESIREAESCSLGVTQHPKTDRDER